MTMTLVSTVTVGSGGAASIDFTSVPQTGTDLLVVLSGRSTDTNRAVGLYFNTSNQVTGRLLAGDGSTATSRSAATDVGQLPPSSATSSTFGNNSYYIPNYTSSTAKSVSVDSVTETNATGAFQFIVAGSSSLTSAITALKLTAVTSFAQYSTASLYTITKGSGGASVS